MTWRAVSMPAGVSRNKRPRRPWQTAVATFGLLAVIAAGCSTSVGSTQAGSATTTVPTVPPTSTDSPQDVRLERHMTTLISATFDGQPEQSPACISRELLRREGGSAGLEKLGIKITTTKSEFSQAIDSMLEDRILTATTEPFDRFVDALFACGGDKQFRTDFLTQLHDKGNTPAASKCLTDRVLGDRYLRLVLVVGQKDGTTEDPSEKTKFEDPLVAAVDRAAAVCGVANW